MGVGILLPIGFVPRNDSSLCRWALLICHLKLETPLPIGFVCTAGFPPSTAYCLPAAAFHFFPLPSYFYLLTFYL